MSHLLNLLLLALLLSSTQDAHSLQAPLSCKTPLLAPTPSFHFKLSDPIGNDAFGFGLGGEEKTGSLRALIGSRPPRCEGRCMSCGRCEAVQMPVIPQRREQMVRMISTKLSLLRMMDPTTSPWAGNASVGTLSLIHEEFLLI
uniref:Uncharacterized protein n=1 Tax=Ananas comosus var. bracteatus TaxID=296719 RepID=A0A6V7QEB4_ANACO|nr:unnamed protein product [Ananas comosus var. bracteatus]